MITVKKHKQRLELDGDGHRQVRSLVKLPREFINWQIQSRKELFERLLCHEAVHFLANHLPVLATINSEGAINLANKGVGLVPKDEHLVRYIDLLTRVLSENHSRPWEETLAERIEAARELLQHPEHIDACRLGSLEIFEGQTFQNIQKNPRVALLFTGGGPEYLSFQLDCIVQVLGPGQPAYEFLRAIRLLFEYERFHIAQPGYPYAYQFWILGVREKTPRRRM